MIMCQVSSIEEGVVDPVLLPDGAAGLGLGGHHAVGQGAVLALGCSASGREPGRDEGVVDDTREEIGHREARGYAFRRASGATLRHVGCVAAIGAGQGALRNRYAPTG